MQSMIVRSAVLLALGVCAAQAQQVQVYSEGKPVAVADPGNAARARIRDERKSRRPLAERPDAVAIAGAHSAATVRCGLDESKYPAERAASPQESAYVAGHSSYLPVPGSAHILLMDEYQRGKAIVDPGKLAVITPQCPAGVGAMYWSHDHARILFATQPVTSIDFPGGRRAMWTARFAKVQDVWVFEEGQRFRKLITLPKEKVVDIYVPDGGGAVWVLSQVEKLDLRTPRAWMRAASGTPARKVDVVLRQVGMDGKVIATIPVARGVATGFAQFIRD